MHIVARGINRQDIFFDDNDRKSFMNIMLHLRKEMDFDITAYCLMDNHVHLIIHDEKKRFSLIMKRLLICYVYHFNEKYNRTGHLFENRFKSECIESIRYLAAAVKYIHNNPEKAGICKTSDYKWSSYREYTGEAYICNTEYVLNLFSNIDNFKKYHEVITTDNSMELDKVPSLSDDEARQIICGIMSCTDPNIILQFNKTLRDSYISDFKSWGISSSQIARLTGISIHIINHVNPKRQM